MEVSNQKHRYLTAFEFPDPFSLTSPASGIPLDFYLLTSYDSHNEAFELLLTDVSSRIWFCKSSISALQPSTIQMPHSEYCKTLLQALTVFDREKKHYSYELRQSRADNESYYGNIILAISLRPDPNFEIFVLGAEFDFQAKSFLEYQNRMFSVLSRSLTHLRNDNKKLRKQLQKQIEEKEEVLRAYDKALLDKNQIENRLISCFLPILNSKKSRIRELNSEIKQLRNSKILAQEDKDSRGLSHKEEFIEEPISPKAEEPELDETDKVSKISISSTQPPKKEDEKESYSSTILRFNANTTSNIKIRKRHRAKPVEIVESVDPLPGKAGKRLKKSSKKVIVQDDDSDESDDYEDLLKNL